MTFNDEEFIYDDDEHEEYESYSVEDALSVLPLEDDEDIVPAEVVMGLSDLDPVDLNDVRKVWNGLPDSQRQMIMERLAEASEADYMLDYSVFAQVGYNDPQPEVRAAAIQAGWADESLDTLRVITDLAKNDPVADVRAAAVSQMGMFIYLGEVEEIAKEVAHDAQEVALKLYRDAKQPIEVQRRALEALSRCTRPEVSQLIQEAYNHDDQLMRISAIHAMGNTYDQVWADKVLNEIGSTDNEMCFEAVRAAGSLSLKEALEPLSELIYAEDRQIQEAAVWSLGEIGGEEAIDLLTELDTYAEENEDDELADAIEEALGMALINEMKDGFEMMVFDEDDYDDEDEDYEEEDDEE